MKVLEKLTNYGEFRKIKAETNNVSNVSTFSQTKINILENSISSIHTAYEVVKNKIN